MINLMFLNREIALFIFFWPGWARVWDFGVRHFGERGSGCPEFAFVVLAHYWNLRKCRAPEQLGKGQLMLGNVFAESSSRCTQFRQSEICSVPSVGNSANILPRAREVVLAK